MTVWVVSVNGSGAGVLAAPQGSSHGTWPGAAGAMAAGTRLAPWPDPPRLGSPLAHQPSSTFPLSPLFVVKMADL